MKQYSNNAIESEQVSNLIKFRHNELEKQHWNRSLSQFLAADEGIKLSDEHWAILIFLRNEFLIAGLPKHARYLSKALSKKYRFRGGNKYLRGLFPGGPITQGSRLANLPLPPDSVDVSHGSCY